MSDQAIQEKPALGSRDLSGPALRTFFKIADAWHLNEKGAVDFTSILAERFIERMKAKP